MNKAAFNVHEIAEMLGISLPKAYELVKQPDFPAIRIGTRIVIPVDSFNKWMLQKAENADERKDDTNGKRRT